MEELVIRLLGHPEIRSGSECIDIPRRQVRALLFVLASQPNLIPRSQLCTLFWPDSPDPAARRNLSHLLTHLRRALPDPDLLQTPGEQVRLDANRVWCDTAVFQHHYLAWQKTGQTANLPAAAALYRGTFMDGFYLPRNSEFDQWLSCQQQFWEETYLKLLAGLIEVSIAAGRLEAAIGYAEDFLTINDLAEEIHCRLIELYAANGDRQAATRQFEHCARVLQAELGVRPLPRTEAAIRATAADAPPPPRVNRTWSVHPSLNVDMVSRDDELRRLEQCFLQVQAGQSRMVLISGEGGIGKSRLAAEFLRVRERQTLIASATCRPFKATVALFPLVEAMRELLESLTTAVPAVIAPLEEMVLPDTAVRLHSLLPSRAETIKDNSAPPAGRPLFENLEQIAVTLAKGAHPLIVLLDDLQWADPPTLDWLGHMASRPDPLRLMLIGTCCCEPTQALARLRHQIQRVRACPELRLKRLDAAAVAAILRQVVSDQPASIAAAADHIHALTGGNPLFILELIRALREQDMAICDMGSESSTLNLNSIREVIRTRVDYLSPLARQILEAVAAIDAYPCFDWIRLTAGRSDIEVMDGLDELVQRHLLDVEGTCYQFSHRLVRNTVLSDLGAVRRELLERRARAAVAQLAADPTAIPCNRPIASAGRNIVPLSAVSVSETPHR